VSRALETLVQEFREGSRAALARLITLLDDGGEIEAIERDLLSDAPRGHVIAVTGAPGVGKSTLVGHLAREIARRDHMVGIVAVDPDSPRTGGALLGDRVRMSGGAHDDRLFIRSQSARGAAGGVSRSTRPIARLLLAFGFDRVLVETVGAGQSDRGVEGLADLIVLVTMPGTGDELQWEKAGLAELADLFVINKADWPGADALETAIRSSFSLSRGPEPTILRTVATSGEGIAALAEVIESRLSGGAAVSSHG
jgi:LAO/AO transport system kinase